MYNWHTIQTSQQLYAEKRKKNVLYYRILKHFNYKRKNYRQKKLTIHLRSQ